MSTIISPSLLSADFLNLGKDVEMVNQSEAEWIHLDIMDGVFVPNISYGLPVVSHIKKAARKAFSLDGRGYGATGDFDDPAVRSCYTPESFDDPRFEEEFIRCAETIPGPFPFREVEI